MFAIFAEERAALTIWLRNAGKRAAAALEQAVAIASLSTETNFNSSAGLIEIRSGVFMRASEAVSEEKLKLKPGQSVEEYLQTLASLPKLAFDTNLGSFAMQRGELQVLPGWAVNCAELQELFQLDGVLASSVHRTEHRECLNLAGERCDLHRWTSDPRPWPVPVAARGARCSWLDDSVQAAGGFPAGLGATRLLDATERMAHLACELEGVEVVVVRDPPTVQIFESLSHARMVYKKLRWTSDACWCLSSFSLQEPWCSETGAWSLCSGQGGAPGSAVKQQSAPPGEETVVIVREMSQESPEQVGAKGGREALLPSALLKGLLPEGLLRAFRFWRGSDGILRAEERNPSQRLPHKIQVEIDADRAKVVRFQPSSHSRERPQRQVLVNLMLSGTSPPLRRLAEVLTRIEDLAFILCWADEGGNVAEIELTRLGLHFKGNSRGGLECLGFNGLCIAASDLSQSSSKVRKLLAQFAGAALLLKGPDGELGVVSSALQRPRRPGGGPMPLEWVAPLVFDRTEFGGIGNDKSGHYFFSIHPSHCYAFAQDLAAELYRLTCCWLMHQYEEVVRAASSLGCDGLSPTESALWMRLGAETANDQHVDAQACRLHLSAALQPLGLDSPWSVRDVYIQYVLNRHRCSASCMLTPELELQVLRMLPELDGLSWLLRNRRRVLEAQSGVLVSLEPAPLAPSDGYEVKVFSEANSKDWTASVSLALPVEEQAKTGLVALRFIEQQLANGPLSMQFLFEALTRAVSLQPFPEDPPHLVAVCLARAHGPASAALALLAREEGFADALPKPPKKQGLLPTAAQRRWLQEVREKLAAVAMPFPEPPAPAPVPREVLLKHDVLRLAAWPIVQVADCTKRAVSGMAALPVPLQEMAQGCLSRLQSPGDLPALAQWLLQEIQGDHRCTSRGTRWVSRLQESLAELQMPKYAPVLRCGVHEMAAALQRQLNYDRQKAAEALSAAEEAASSLDTDSNAASFRALQLQAGVAPRIEFFGLVRLFMADCGADILAALGINEMKTLALVADALFLQVRATQCATALRVLREEDGRSAELKGKVVAEEVAKERHFLSGGMGALNGLLDPRLLAVEFLFGIMLRETQVQVLQAFVTGKEDAWVHQMLMGGGKTCVVAPIAAALLSTPARLFVAIVPSQAQRAIPAVGQKPKRGPQILGRMDLESTATQGFGVHLSKPSTN
ncbi:unnamed protein product [Effrenium voratum]|nr:unnamed protein product [Effrenium voratum]